MDAMQNSRQFHCCLQLPLHTRKLFHKTLNCFRDLKDSPRASLQDFDYQFFRDLKEQLAMRLPNLLAYGRWKAMLLLS